MRGFYGKYAARRKFGLAKSSIILIAFNLPIVSLSRSTKIKGDILKTELCKKALEKVGNPNVLVNLVSQRVRQLNAGGGGSSRPLVANTTGLGMADIAMLEIIEEKMGWDLPEHVRQIQPARKKRKKH